jgi:hypothetical protein
LLLGLALYRFGAAVVSRQARPFALLDQPARVPSLLRRSYVAVSAAACAAAAFYAPGRGAALWQAALEVGAASWPLLVITARRSVTAPAGGIPEGAAAEGVLERSLAWIGFSAALFVAFVATLGRGIG